ncbi:MAG: hypothetical protein HYY76_16005 [Acidobacteria bacterium]|nr:hypothetical protein [Acidobacteriota bacterium]
MRDDLDAGVAIEDAGEDEPRHRRHGVVEPPRDAPRIEAARRLRRIVGSIGAAHRVQQHRHVEPGDAVEERRELRIVERPPVDVGVDLDGAEPEPMNVAIELGERGDDVVEDVDFHSRQ